MRDLEILLAILLVVLFLTFLAAWSVLGLWRILKDFILSGKEKTILFYELSSWEIFKLTIKTLSHGPFAYKILSRYQKEDINGD